MLRFVTIGVYAIAFAALMQESAISLLKSGDSLSFLIWIAGIVISLIPIVRTIVLAIVLSLVSPWYFAIPIAAGINLGRFMLVTHSKRKAALALQKMAAENYIASRQPPNSDSEDGIIEITDRDGVKIRLPETSISLGPASMAYLMTGKTPPK